ncbi:MAG: PilW family protein [Candidatus Accumulibacter sp.]|jgi:type IV pilus assembly protein PilW|nr:PilW family protein [Accumulibacter sp.]
MKKIPANKNSGFSLVEILVGMVIGMVGLIIMMQIFSFVEGQKRTTTGTGDAQTTGVSAIYALQRDLRYAGYGINALNVIGCPLDLGGGKTLPVLTHVVINPANIPAGDPSTDVLLVSYGNGNGSTQGEVIINAAGTQLMMPSSLTYRVGDKVIATTARPMNVSCALRLASVTSVSGQNLTLSSGDGAFEEGALFNLGSAPKILAYAVHGGNLTVCDYMASNCTEDCTAADGTCSSAWVPIADNVVSLRAQYGRDTTVPMNGSIDVWDQTTPVQPSPVDQEKYACLWVRAPAVRIAVVARNAQIEKEAVTPVAPAWYGSATHPINLTATRTNWQHYRYRLFQTVVPIRNIPWMTLCPY